MQELRFKLIAAFIVLASVPLAGFGVYAYHKGVEMAREKAVSHLGSVVDGQAQMITSFVSERKGDLNLLAGTIFRQSPPPPAHSLFQHLSLMKEEYRVYRDLALFDPEGKPVLAAGREDGWDSVPAGQEWHSAALGGEIFTGSVFPDSDGRLSVLVSVPVYGAGLEVSGVLAAVVDFQNMADSVTGASIGDTGEFYLVDRSGRLLTGTRLGPGKPGQKIFTGQMDGPSGEVEVREYIDYRGKLVLRVLERLPGLDWIIVAEQDSEEAFAEINSLRRAVFGIVAMLIFLTSITAWALSNRIVGFLEKTNAEKEELELQVIQKDKLASMGFLTAGIAHELNTPLASALLNAQMLKEDTGKIWPEHGATLDSIAEEIQRGSAIVRNLLAFSRQSQISSTLTDVNEVLARLLELARKLCSERGISVKRSFQENMPMVKADGAALHQVFMNMVANAVEAMETGGTLEVSTRHVPVLGKVKVEIQDTGPGIPKEYLGNVFDPFFTTKKSGEGTGLGLAISYGMVRKMGGNIRVMSVCEEDVGRQAGPTGTVFVVELPVEEKNGPATKP